MKSFVTLLLLALFGACERQIGDTGTAPAMAPAAVPLGSLAGQASYGTIDTLQITQKRSKPHQTDILTFYVAGSWNTNITQIQSASSISGSVVTIDLYITSGLDLRDIRIPRSRHVD